MASSHLKEFLSELVSVGDRRGCQVSLVASTDAAASGANNNNNNNNKSQQQISIRGPIEQVDKVKLSVLETIQKIMNGREVVQYPDEWEPQTENCELKPVARGSAEWNMIEQRAKETTIERVQNQWLWERYCTERIRIARKNNNDPNEMLLWHGTSGTCFRDNSLRLPPPKPNQSSSMFAVERYDSVSGQTGGSDVYIVYENGRAYPSYLVTYQ